MGSLPWGVKVAVSLVGLSGSKEKGIEYLYEVARANTENSVDAKIALLLFLRRERRYSEALPILRGLIQQYPGNVILALEEGTLLRGLNQPQDAAAAYRRVWDAGKVRKDPRPRTPPGCAAPRPGRPPDMRAEARNPRLNSPLRSESSAATLRPHPSSSAIITDW